MEQAHVAIKSWAYCLHTFRALLQGSSLRGCIARARSRTHCTSLVCSAGAANGCTCHRMSCAAITTPAEHGGTGNASAAANGRSAAMLPPLVHNVGPGQERARPHRVGARDACVDLEAAADAVGMLGHQPDGREVNYRDVTDVTANARGGGSGVAGWRSRQLLLWTCALHEGGNANLSAEGPSHFFRVGCIGPTCDWPPLNTTARPNQLFSTEGPPRCTFAGGDHVRGPGGDDTMGMSVRVWRRAAER